MLLPREPAHRPLDDSRPRRTLVAPRRWTVWLLALALVAASAACSSDGGSGSTPDADASSDAVADGSPDGAPDGEGDVPGDLSDEDSGSPEGAYAHVAPPAGEVPAALQGNTWRDHWVDDLRPYWMQAAAWGTPEGNFPTYRGMDGSVQSPSERRPRMIARQTYAYSVGFMLTGEERLLQLAHAGATWLMDHAVDPQGGCYELLQQDGSPQGSGPKYAQDTAYCALGLAAYYYVTRDPDAEAQVLALRDLLFGPMWDEEHGRILDGLTADLSAPVNQTEAGASELVAQLDPVNGFMLLVQPVLSDPARRAQFLDDMEALANVMLDQFWADGIFWGLDVNQGEYGTRHVDFGHTLKSYWMILQLDKRLPDNPFHDFVMENAYTWVERAYDDANGRWGNRPTSATEVQWGSDWWIYAEADQIAGTLNLIDYRYTDELAQTGAHWLSDFVDDREAGEVIPTIRRDGSPVYPWPDSDTAKCNLWKNGFHSSEHALVMYLLGRNLEGEPAELHFAVPSDEVSSFIATPYIFNGHEVSRTESGDLSVGGATLRHVVVAFDGLY